MKKAGERVVAKAIAPELQSDAIVVSFVSEWDGRIKRESFKVIIRKRVPKTISPRWLYFHVNAPISAICARAEIISVSNITCPEAVKIYHQIDMSKAEIKHYFGQENTVGCYLLGNFFFPEKAITVKELRDRMVYYPPQSFFILSKDGKRLLDIMCGFGNAFLKTE